MIATWRDTDVRLLIRTRESRSRDSSVATVVVTRGMIGSRGVTTIRSPLWWWHVAYLENLRDPRRRAIYTLTLGSENLRFQNSSEQNLLSLFVTAFLRALSSRNFPLRFFSSCKFFLRFSKKVAFSLKFRTCLVLVFRSLSDTLALIVCVGKSQDDLGCYQNWSFRVPNSLTLVVLIYCEYRNWPILVIYYVVSYAVSFVCVNYRNGWSTRCCWEESLTFTPTIPFTPFSKCFGNSIPVVPIYWLVSSRIIPTRWWGGSTSGGRSERGRGGSLRTCHSP